MFFGTIHYSVCLECITHCLAKRSRERGRRPSCYVSVSLTYYSLKTLFLANRATIYYSFFCLVGKIDPPSKKRKKN
jgi:hypothetical protein